MAIRSVFPSLLGMVAGVFLGWLATSYSTPKLGAGQADRSGESVMATGPVSIVIDQVTRQASTTDALYYLDYSGGKLLATIPMYRQTSDSTRILGDFAVRDLVADFKPPRGTTPKFVMSIGQLGMGAGTGWAPLYVMETTTKMVATYKVSPGPVRDGRDPKPIFELLEVKRLP